MFFCERRSPKRAACRRPSSESSASLDPEKRSSSVAAVAPCRTRNKRVIVIAFILSRVRSVRSRSWQEFDQPLDELLTLVQDVSQLLLLGACRFVLQFR